MTKLTKTPAKYRMFNHKRYELALVDSLSDAKLVAKNKRSSGQKVRLVRLSGKRVAIYTRWG